jgi:hypothetical protein
MIREVEHNIYCSNFSELETPDDGRVQPKHVRRKGDKNKLYCR